MIITKGFNVPPAPPAAPNDDADNVAHMYPCFTSINCIYNGTDEHKRVEECLDGLDTYDLQIAMDWYEQGLQATDYIDTYDAISLLYCTANGETRKFLFDKIAQGSMELYSVGCERRHPQKACNHFSSSVDCFLNLLQELEDEEKCDIEELDKRTA
ncbi:hypothetical protein TNCV_950321 [Trichonephila clavipes]|nr:hypothetical protein TNCV_950321 [Trichonephila clavipes]